jgi:hypothetical protein
MKQTVEMFVISVWAVYSANQDKLHSKKGVGRTADYKPERPRIFLLLKNHHVIENGGNFAHIDL